MNSFLTKGQLQNRTQLREQFIHDLLAILGDTRLLFLPKPTDGTTSLDESLNGRTLTHDATIASRLRALGLGYYTTFDGAANYAATPDQANLSFLSGTDDAAWSAIALCNVTDTATTRAIIAKSDGATNIEWTFRVVTAGDVLEMLVFDQSAGASCFRRSDAAINLGSWALFGGSYDGRGAGAATGMTLYQNGAAIASTATNDSGGVYADMENLGSEVAIGAHSIHAAAFFNGSIALVAICQKNLSASDHWAIKKLVNAYYNLSL